MSGTLGITPIRAIGVDGIRHLAKWVLGHVALVRRRGGLPVRVAVPVALVVTAAVVSVTVGLASSWVAA